MKPRNLICRVLRRLLVPALLLGLVRIAGAGQNVLLIIVDDLRPELPAYGSEFIRAPGIDKLVAEGVVFENAYANVPVCGASRASLFTGLRPTARRFVGVDARIDEDAPDIVPLHTFLKARGYHTESIGKVIHNPRDAVNGWSQKPWHPNEDVPKERHTGHRDYQLDENIEAFMSQGKGPPVEAADLPDNAYFDGQIAERAIASLRHLSKAGSPFFLAVGFVKPHLPFTAPKRYWDRYPDESIRLAQHPVMPEGMPAQAVHQWGELRNYAGIPERPAPVDAAMARTLRHGYYASVSYADAQVARVLEELSSLGIDDDTIVILTSDHGWSLGEHGLWAKHSPFDVATRIPLIVRIPGLDRGGRSPALVELVDLYPTIVDLLEIDSPGHLQGQSFEPQILDPVAPGKTAVFPRWKSGQVIKTDRYSMTTWQNPNGKIVARMLFDHATDRDEVNNLADDETFADIIRDLDAETTRLIGEVLEGIR